MFFIYGTDAPIYHYPITTSVMIGINVFVHILAASAGWDVTPWILAFGDGLHPLQWLTHNFLHINYFHLIGNMIFLFPFGLIVEGKIGWARMLVLYLAIGMAQGFSQQLMMLPTDPSSSVTELLELVEDPNDPMSEEEREELRRKWRKDLVQEGFGSLGASAVIFGLLAACAIWAPQNEFDVYFRWSPIHAAPDGGMREWSVLTVCGIFVVKELGMFLMMGMSVSSEALHLNGFVVGGFISMGMLYLGHVDCEGFDLISLYTGTKFKGKAIIAAEVQARMEAREAAEPTGPPQAIVPVMPHELPVERRELEPTIRLPAPPSVPLVAPVVPAVPFATSLADLALPEFDDGTAQVDPLAAQRAKLETLIASQDFTSAVRFLAEVRKSAPAFIASPASTGRLAEGLIRQQHVKPAITVLTIGCQAYPAYEPRWRIRIASLELAANKNAVAAIEQLRMIDKEMLDTQLRQQYVKLGKLAKDMASGS